MTMRALKTNNNDDHRKRLKQKKQICQKLEPVLGIRRRYEKGGRENVEWHPGG